MVILVISAWPRQFTPAGRVSQAVMLAANHTLAMLLVRPSVNIFTGDLEGDRTITLRSCFSITGHPPKQPAELLFDSMDKCEPGAVAWSKEPFEWFHNHNLRRALATLYNPHAERTLNAIPLNVLFSLADYHCHHRGEGRFRYLSITSRYQRRNLDTGEVTDVETLEGLHQCESGRWDVRRKRLPLGDHAL